MRDKADALRTALKSDPLGAFAAEFKSNRIDAMIGYCSGSAALEKDEPDLEAIPFPTTLDPAPVFGLVVLTNRPEALKTALFVLSEPGQALLRRAGLIPPPRAAQPLNLQPAHLNCLREAPHSWGIEDLWVTARCRARFTLRSESRGSGRRPLRCCTNCPTNACRLATTARASRFFR